LGASVTGSYSENNADDSCEVVVPKLNKMIENINEMMTGLEQQTDSEHLHLLHVANIKQYVLKCTLNFICIF
jgi:tRNA/tmRNA/rRNA uracil-C5-methylase (TrmA/RlmC/RlmD family)